MVEYQKKNKYNKIHGIYVIVGDFAEHPAVMRSNINLLSTLVMRGRRLMCSTTLSTQKFRAMATTIRTNARLRLGSHKELLALLEEISAVYPSNILARMRQHATEEPYSFLHCLLTAKKKEDMFFKRFKERLVGDEE